MVRVAILGHGYVASHLLVGLERIKLGEIEKYGIPLANYKLPYEVEDIEIVATYDVDKRKIGRTAYELAREIFDKDGIRVPESLKELIVSEGVHLGSLEGLPFEPRGLDERMSLREAMENLIEQWKRDKIEVFLNVITTEHGEPFKRREDLERAIREEDRKRLTASQFYAYAVAEYSKDNGGAVFVNGIPSPLANDPAFISLYEESDAILLGDDGATGATPLTSDLLEHLFERNRRVRYIVQFNIGGNTDFLALSIPERNIMKEKTKSSIVQDILGYDAPHFIKPTGYLEPIGDRKFIAMDIEYISFNGFVDELIIAGRINDSPAMAGLMIDAMRLGKVALDLGEKGTVYEINAFVMKNPGPEDAKAVARIVAYYRLLDWLKEKGVLES